MTRIQIDHVKARQEKKWKTALDRSIENNLKYWKRVKEELDAKETKAKNIFYRDQMLQKQKADNYRREKERLLSILHNQSIPNATHNLIERRLKEIQNFVIA